LYKITNPIKTINMKKTLLFLALVASVISQAQVAVGTSTATMNGSAQLEITSNNKGFLPPRMTQAQRNDIITPAQGLIVYCTNCGPVGEAQVFNGNAWTNICGSPALGIKPTITTTTVSDIAASNAKSGGTIVSNGGDNITVSGIVWSTSTNPTTALTTKTTNGTVTGSFTSTMAGLAPETTYYVRAYATNSIGTSYGAEESFTTATAPVASDGEVTIGSQIWTTRNLNVATYSDGTEIPQVTDPAAWESLTTGAWCYYNNDPANEAVYGKLYNWYAVAGIWNEASKTDESLRKQLAPAGYHVPSQAEMLTLIDGLGGAANAHKMKAIGEGIWPAPGPMEEMEFGPTPATTNSTGFTARPGGFRYSGTDFYNIGYVGFWWSISIYDAVRANRMQIISNNIYVQFGENYNGFSVRCIKD
jgi:uncharacterized protein (TIGR02145 family)